MSETETIEVMLLRWGESPTGRTATFLLPEDTPHHPFKGLRTGATNGERLELSVKVIADDENTHEIKTDEKPKREMTLPQYVGMICQDENFQTFINEKFVDIVEHYEIDYPTDKIVAEIVRAECGVISRSEINYDTPAQKKWSALYSDFKSWLEKQS